ncbi:MPN domain-containing protein [Myotis brandtii]|uniref:MPN domain-containing protein n=1 Tax=Myotis brandtii TaxID=109478 RepID=S7PHA5_MYOBR|nr:MPN domain-containing protein [Myotis brandtii]
MDYQLRLQGSSNGFQPCLTLLCSPYYSGNQGPESKISPFWVMPPPEQRPSGYGIPMDVEMAYVQDSFLTNDILHEMLLLVEFYKAAPDLVRFQEPWNQEHTYLDKLKISLASRMPKDRGLCHVLEQEVRVDFIFTFMLPSEKQYPPGVLPSSQTENPILDSDNRGQENIFPQPILKQKMAYV